MATIRQHGTKPEKGAISSVFHPSEPESHSAYWRINGYRATILIWTEAEWKALEVRPPDAQFYPCGVWCALRIDPSP